MVLDVPGKLNAVDGLLHGDLANVWRDIDSDPNIRAVLLRAEGSAFSAGGDMKWVRQLTESFEARARGFREARDLVYSMVNCSKPTVSAINGIAVGAGLAFALLTHVSLAGKSAVLLDGHTRIGVAAGDHGVLCWPICVGWRAPGITFCCASGSTARPRRVLAWSPNASKTPSCWIVRARLQPDSQAVRRRPYAGPSTLSTTGYGWRFLHSTPHSPWNSLASTQLPVNSPAGACLRGWLSRLRPR